MRVWGLQGAFYHKASKTLMVTEAVQYLPDKPPEVRPDNPFFFGKSCGAELASNVQAGTQVINRAKLLRAGKDNAFVRLVRLPATLSFSVQ